jgi:hypothetical protein
VIFALVTVGVFTVSTGSVGLERFRFPMMLPLFLLVGYAADSLRGRAGAALPLPSISATST